MKTGSLSTACCPCLDLKCITEVTMEADMGPSTQALLSEVRRRRFPQDVGGSPAKAVAPAQRAGGERREEARVADSNLRS